MASTTGRTVAVVGATGRQGGQVVRHLLAEGWRVRALSRTPTGKKGAELNGLGADVVYGDRWDIMSALNCWTTPTKFGGGGPAMNAFNLKKAGDKVVVVVRPESIVLHQKKPSHGDNVLEGKIGAAMFLGEYVDCTIELGKNVLETHQPHSLRVRRGDTVWVELPVGDCMALPAEQ